MIPEGVVDMDIQGDHIVTQSFQNEIQVGKISETYEKLYSLQHKAGESFRVKFEQDLGCFYTGGFSGILYKYDTKNQAII